MCIFVGIQLGENTQQKIEITNSQKIFSIENLKKDRWKHK